MRMIGTVRALNKYFEHIPYWAIALLARFIVGLVFYRSGLTKIDGFAIKDGPAYPCPMSARLYKISNV